MSAVIMMKINFFNVIITGFYRFVRRQKDIALAQWEASKGEALRYKERMEQQSREIKELKEALNTERMKMQVGHFFGFIFHYVFYYYVFSTL